MVRVVRIFFTVFYGYTVGRLCGFTVIVKVKVKVKIKVDSRNSLYSPYRFYIGYYGYIGHHRLTAQP